MFPGDSAVLDERRTASEGSVRSTLNIVGQERDEFQRLTLNRPEF